MKTIKYLFTLTLFIIGCFSSSGREIVTPRVEADYNARLSNQAAIKEKLTIPSGLGSQEEDALKFLFAYMPTPDILNHDTEFFIKNARLALKSSEEMPWGKNVPDREWRHFVLPVRVNNEDLDLSREVFYDELKDRVRNLSMQDAILEVNHWCHEKVSYQPSDPRTSAPLATVRNALGRCGEESTFTVAALRSVGIPARQVYTPRWAHTDDNHAWVEAWADGEWHFLGACEPEPVLDLAWFNAPAARGMLMNTNVIGYYDGPEEKLAMTPVSTEINVTSNYTPVKKTVVHVTDTAGFPVKNAPVRFSIYNYAEYYPLAVKYTDEKGYVEFDSGEGDMIVWATDGELFNLEKVRAGETISLILNKNGEYTGILNFDLIPPPPGGTTPQLSEETIIKNDIRKAKEDSIRLQYVNSFYNHDKAEELCKKLGFDLSIVDILVKSRGNHQVIETFLRTTPDTLKTKATELLKVLSEKDLHDVTLEVLNDNLISGKGDEGSPLYIPYVLNPRVEYEMLRPYKEKLLDFLTHDRIIRYTTSPRLIAEDLKNHNADDMYNPKGLRQSALSTVEDGIGDPLNLSIAFVSICRSLGIPARIDPVTHSTEYADAVDHWHGVSFEKDGAKALMNDEKTILHINNMSQNIGREPKYYSQFTLSRIVDGKPELMEFDDFESLESINHREKAIPTGQYLLTTGQRLADGSVLSRSEFFIASPEEMKSPQLLVRQDSTALQVIGNLDAELLYERLKLSGNKLIESSKESVLSTTGRGYYVLGIISPGHEPSAHALNDIAAAAKELEATGRKILIILPDKDSICRFKLDDYGSLPKNVVFGVDDGSILKGITEGLEIPTPVSSDFPLFVVADTFNRIVYYRNGYSINLGQTLADILRSLEK